MVTDRRVIEPLDHFIQKPRDDEALRNWDRNAASAQIKEFVFVDLRSGSGLPDFGKREAVALLHVENRVVAKNEGNALILARCLGSARESVVALRAYEACRMKRSAAIIEQSYRFGRIGQWENPLLCSLRDALTPLAFVTVLPGEFAAIVQGSPVGEVRGGAGSDHSLPATHREGNQNFS